MSTRTGVHQVAAPIAANRPAGPPMKGVLARTTGSSRVGRTMSGGRPSLISRYFLGFRLEGRSTMRAGMPVSSAM